MRRSRRKPNARMPPTRYAIDARGGWCVPWVTPTCGAGELRTRCNLRCGWRVTRPHNHRADRLGFYSAQLRSDGKNSKRIKSLRRLPDSYAQIYERKLGITLRPSRGRPPVRFSPFVAALIA